MINLKNDLFIIDLARDRFLKQFHTDILAADLNIRPLPPGDTHDVAYEVYTKKLNDNISLRLYLQVDGDIAVIDNYRFLGVVLNSVSTVYTATYITTGVIDKYHYWTGGRDLRELSYGISSVPVKGTLVNTSSIGDCGDLTPVGAINICDILFNDPNYILITPGMLIDLTIYPDLSKVLTRYLTGGYNMNITIFNPIPSVSDNFGYEFDLNGDGSRLVSGCRNYDSTTLSDIGRVYIYLKINNSYTLEATIDPPIPSSYDHFGRTLKIDEAGNRVLVGATGRDGLYSNIGEVYIYVRSGTTWSLEATITNPVPSYHAYFGHNTAISNDGSRIVVGAYGATTGFPTATDIGSIYIYLRTGTTWTLEQTINNPNLTPISYEEFSWGLHMSGLADRIVVGADQTTINGTSDAGTLFIFLRTGTTWALEQTIDNPFPATYDYFAAHLHIDPTGTRIAVAQTGNIGSVYIYLRTGTTWALEQRLLNPEGTTSTSFGRSIALNDTHDKLIVGDSFSDAGGTNTGSVYIYNRTGNSWILDNTIFNPDPTLTNSEWFGVHVATDSTGDLVAVAAAAEASIKYQSGAIYVGSRYPKTTIAVKPTGYDSENKLQPFLRIK